MRNTIRLAASLAAALLWIVPSQAQDVRKVNFSKDLLKDVPWQYSTDGGKTFSPQGPAPAAGKSIKVVARAVFGVSGPSFFDANRKPTFVALQLTTRLDGEWTARLNGKPVAPPVEGVRFRTLPGIDPKMLRQGENDLVISATAVASGAREDRGKPWAMGASLLAQNPEDLAFRNGPIVGACGEDFFSLTCRTNMPADVDLTVETSGGRTFRKTSSGEIFHRFRVDGLDGPWTSYRLTARREKFQIHFGANGPRRSADPPGAMRFIALGDSRSNPDHWARVAAAVHKAGPEFVAFTGDMAGNGRNDWEWDEQYLTPGKDLLATIPLYPVYGNHEQKSPLFRYLFYTPGGDGRDANWTHTVRYVQLIGINGEEDWSAGSRNARWLEDVLKGSKAKFIFLFSHYPAWTSSSHGKLDKAGKPTERAIREGQEVILPLLSKYKATAMVVGHDHCYERSEPPGGVTQIIAGGAGAPLRGKSSDAARQNPYSQVYHEKLHYCMFDLNGEVCTMRAITPEGQQLDEKTWEYRGAPPRPAETAPAEPPLVPVP